MAEAIKLWSKEALSDISKVADQWSKSSRETIVALQFDNPDTAEHISWEWVEQWYGFVKYNNQAIERSVQELWLESEKEIIKRHQHPDGESIHYSAQDNKQAKEDKNRTWEWRYWIYQKDQVWDWELHVTFDEHWNQLKQEAMWHTNDVIYTGRDGKLNKYLKDVDTSEYHNTDKLLLKAELEYIADNNQYSQEEVYNAYWKWWSIEDMRKWTTKIIDWNSLASKTDVDKDDKGKDELIHELKNKLNLAA